MKKPSKFHVFLSLRLLLLSCSFVAVLWLRCQFNTSHQRQLDQRQLLYRGKDGGKDRNRDRDRDRDRQKDGNHRVEEEMLERKARFIPPQRQQQEPPESP